MKKINYLTLNKKTLKPGKLYRHREDYNDWYFKRNVFETKYTFFYCGDTFQMIGVDKNETLLFIKSESMPNFSGNIGINCIFLYGKILIESYYENADSMLIFEEV